MSLNLNNKHFSLHLQDKIEFILPNQFGNQLAIQTKNKITLLHVISLEILHVLEIESTFQNLTIKAFDDHKVLLVQFNPEENPDVLNLLVFDWLQPQPIFELSNTRLISFSNNWIEIPHAYFAGKTTIIDINTFNLIEEKTKTDFTYDIKHPTAYTRHSSYFDWFVQLLNKYQLIPVKMFEFLKWNDYLLLSYYVENGDLTNYLSIYDLEGKELVKFLLDNELKGIGKDTFFVIENKLIFVTDKSTLNVLQY